MIPYHQVFHLSLFRDPVTDLRLIRLHLLGADGSTAGVTIGETFLARGCGSRSDVTPGRMTVRGRTFEMDLRQFEKWLKDVESVSVDFNRLDYSSWMKNRDRSGPDDMDEYIVAVCDSFETLKSHSDGTIWVSRRDNKDLIISPSKPQADFMAALNLFGHSTSTELRNFQTKRLSIVNAHSDFTLSNLIICNLELGSQTASFKLENCLIGTLSLARKSAQNFNVSGGMILNIHCPPPEEENPFYGSVNFGRNVYFPKKSHKSGRLLTGAQPYRNMRAHMTKLENAPMMSRFHKLEQLIERENQSRFDRLLSRGYNLLSGYGTSSGRPILWLLSLIAGTFLLSLVDGGAVSDDLAGWQTHLRGYGLEARAGRAFILAIQTTLNPLGVFGTRGTVVANSSLLAWWLVFHGVASTLLVALFIFAVRRRFKVS